jgi:hypothetical protein
VLRVRWKIIVACTLVALAAAGFISFRSPKIYEASTSLFLSVNVGQTSSELSRGFTYAQGLASSYAQVATQPVVLQPVITPAPLDSHARPAGALDQRHGAAGHRHHPGPGERRLGAGRGVDRERTPSSWPPTTSCRGRPSGAAPHVAVQVTVVSPASVPGSPSSPRIPLNSRSAC